MTTRYIVANQSFFSSSQGDFNYIAPGVSISGGIDLRGTANGNVTYGGDQFVFVGGTIFGSIYGRGAPADGGNQITISSTGTVVKDWFGAIDLAGGGNSIFNAGLIASTVHGTAIYIDTSTGAHLGDVTTIDNLGTISSESRNPGGAAAIRVFGSSAVNLNNSGSILSAYGQAIDVSNTNGGHKIFNSGLIDGSVSMTGGGTLDTRQGTINGAIYGYTGQNVIYGSAFNDSITTGSGNDFIDGHLGADLMEGGGGADTYWVDNAGDVVNDSGGTDTIVSFINFDLSDLEAAIGVIETLRLGGADDIDATGSAGADLIIGNTGENTLTGGLGVDDLRGRAGVDKLFGEGGSDKLFGQAGDDVLSGGTGNDSLDGGAGDDTMLGRRRQ